MAITVEDRFAELLIGGQNRNGHHVDDTPAKLRAELERWRRDVPGIGFRPAWLIALGVTLGGLSTGKRRQWCEAFAGTQQAWQDAYDGRELARRRL